MKPLLKIIKIIYNILFFIILSAAIIYIWWIVAGKAYITSPHAIGGDYFLALTYVNYISQHLILPPLGWLPFWEEGSPMIGGYPWLIFYFMSPFFHLSSPANIMELFTALSTLIFFLTGLLLFKQVSKNWLIAFSLALLLVVTKATYNAINYGGYIVSATALWYLPVVILFVSLYKDYGKKQFLVIAGIFSGLSFLHHSPTGIITVIAPAFLYLTIQNKQDNTFYKKIKSAAIYILVTSSIGAMGLYTLLLQTFAGHGNTACAQPECWGIYPRHLIVWMNPLPPILLIILLLIYLLVMITKKTRKRAGSLAPVAGLCFLILFLTAAYYKLINGVANVYFPTRVLWAVNFFILLICAQIFRGLQINLKKLSLLFGLILTIIIITSTYLFPPQILNSMPNVMPNDIDNYFVPKYKNNSLTELVPSWIDTKNTNWRMDTFNEGLTQWWNAAYDIPNTRSYSFGTNLKWEYYLQSATREPKSDNAELVKNRALFLIDMFGIGYRENSIASYPSSILNDPEIVINQERKREFFWYQFSPDVVSPVISPTNSNAVLFIGDDNGFENFIRTIAMTNLNSFHLIPVKGPDNIDDISTEELKNFNAVICYRYKGNNWSKLTGYVKNGSSIFIESASLDNPLEGNAPEIFPVNTLKTDSTTGSWEKGELSNTDSAADFSLENFSPLKYDTDPWKISTADISEIRSWAKPVLKLDNNVLIAQGPIGNGYIYWSGMNLLYHIIKYDNYDEAKLFSSILSPVTNIKPEKPAFTLTRPDPGLIKIKGENFKGIYFKENYDAGWNASVNGKKARIYKAGLDMMYIPVTVPGNNQLDVTLSYNGSPASWILFFISLISFIICIIYLIIPAPFHRLGNMIHKHLTQKYWHRLTSWIHTEEE